MSDAEARALAELDRRAGRATTALLARIDDLVDDTTPPDAGGDPGPSTPVLEPVATSPGDAGHATDPAHATRPRHAADPLGRSGRPGRRRWAPLLLAAAIVVVAGILATLAVTRDKPADVASGGTPPYLLPSWLPPGLELDRATLVEDSGTTGIAGHVTTDGDPRAADPWADTLTVVEILGAGRELYRVLLLVVAPLLPDG